MAEPLRVRTVQALPATTPGVEFKYVCTLRFASRTGDRASGEILVNAHYPFIVRRISWEYVTQTERPPKVRVTWKDARRSYMDRPALITAAFGRPGEEFALVAPIRIDAGTTLTFEGVSAQDEGSEVDIVIHGIELRRDGG